MACFPGINANLVHNEIDPRAGTYGSSEMLPHTAVEFDPDASTCSGPQAHTILIIWLSVSPPALGLALVATSMH